MVIVIDETTHFYKTRCKNCDSYLIFEGEDERCYHEKIEGYGELDVQSVVWIHPLMKLLRQE